MLDFSDHALLELVALGLATKIHKTVLDEMPVCALLAWGKCKVKITELNGSVLRGYKGNADLLFRFLKKFILGRV